MQDKTALVIEDNELNLKLVRSLFKLGGYTVDEQSSFHLSTKILTICTYSLYTGIIREPDVMPLIFRFCSRCLRYDGRNEVTSNINADRIAILRCIPRVTDPDDEGSKEEMISWKARLFL